MTEDSLRLSDEQIQLLIDYDDLDRDAELVRTETVESIRSVLADAITQSTGGALRNPEALDLETLALQLGGDGSAVADSLVDANQMPETGGVDETDDSDDADGDPDVVDALEAADPETRKQTKLLLSKAGVHDRNDRLPAHASALRENAARHLEVSVDDLEAALDRGEIDVPSDPKLLLE